MAIEFRPFSSEQELPAIISLIENDLSEPYCIYTYRYFLHQWPHLTLLAYDVNSESENKSGKIVGVIICKSEVHRTSGAYRGYIAMLAVHQDYRHRQIGSTLVRKVIEVMRNPPAADGVRNDDQSTNAASAIASTDEVVLETEITNKAAMRLYQRLGFVRDKRLSRYYLNGVDAFRLKLWL